MVDVTPLVKEGAKIIQSYTDNQFRISGEYYESAVIVFENRVIPWNTNKDIDNLTFEDFEPLLACKDDADVVLFGTGEKLSFLKPELKRSLKKEGLHLEMMDTGAAARTYNVLMAEGRRVAAALLPHR